MIGLLIRPPVDADAAALLRFERDNRAWFESWVHARDASFYSLDGVAAAIESAAADRAADRGYQYLVLADGEIVGRVNLRGVERPRTNSAELGYRVGAARAGQGIASRAVALCLAQAFEVHALWRVRATARPENLASIRVLERNGFQAFGLSLRCLRVGGEWVDLRHFERHASEAS